MKWGSTIVALLILCGNRAIPSSCATNINSKLFLESRHRVTTEVILHRTTEFGVSCTEPIATTALPNSIDETATLLTYICDMGKKFGASNVKVYRKGCIKLWMISDIKWRYYLWMVACYTIISGDKLFISASIYLHIHSTAAFEMIYYLTHSCS